MSFPSRYKFKSKITGGGMSETSLHVDENLGRDVLIKSISNAVDQHRILDEIHSLQNIRSKYVVQVFDIIRDVSNDQITHLVEEFVNGRSLLQSDFIANGQLNILTLFQIAKGISEIHSSGAIHRDLKSENMLIDTEGYIKIFDFGLSKAAPVNGIAYTNTIIGTAGHMAPELFQAQASGGYNFSEAVDVYAFGAIVLRALVGIPPELLALPPAKVALPAYFSSIAGLPPKIADLLNRCLSSDPLQRPAMESIADSLERELLKDRHKVMVCTPTKTYILDSTNRSIALSAAGKGGFALNYDGYDLKISNVQGIVNVNNMALVSGNIVPSSCVVVLGSPKSASGHTNVTVDTSHPGVHV